MGDTACGPSIIFIDSLVVKTKTIMTHDTKDLASRTRASKTLVIERLLHTGASFRKTRVLKMDRELPRLTSALREFGGVSSPLSREPVYLDEAVLIKKREKKKKERASSQESWAVLTEDVLAECSKHDANKVQL